MENNCFEQREQRIDEHFKYKGGKYSSSSTRMGNWVEEYTIRQNKLDKLAGQTELYNPHLMDGGRQFPRIGIDGKLNGLSNHYIPQSATSLLTQEQYVTENLPQYATCSLVQNGMGHRSMMSTSHQAYQNPQSYCMMHNAGHFPCHG